MSSIEGKLLAVALGVSLLLIPAPFAPPQAAVLSFLGIFVLGTAVLWAYRDISEQMAAARSESEPSEGTVEAVQAAYLEGEITEREMEDELEEALKS